MLVIILYKGQLKQVQINRRSAIYYRCLECSGDSPKEVNDCQVLDCPLFDFRTGRGQHDSKYRALSIRRYCYEWCMQKQASLVWTCDYKLCPLFSYRRSTIDKSAEVVLDKKIANRTKGKSDNDRSNIKRRKKKNKSIYTCIQPKLF